jgi:hypothetical protein
MERVYAHYLEPVSVPPPKLRLSLSKAASSTSTADMHALMFKLEESARKETELRLRNAVSKKSGAECLFSKNIFRVREACP